MWKMNQSMTKFLSKDKMQWKKCCHFPPQNYIVYYTKKFPKFYHCLQAEIGLEFKYFCLKPFYYVAISLVVFKFEKNISRKNWVKNWVKSSGQNTVRPLRFAKGNFEL